MDIHTFVSQGDIPGWIYGHKARFVGPDCIVISGGKVCKVIDGKEQHVENEGSFRFGLSDRNWNRI